MLNFIDDFTIYLPLISVIAMIFVFQKSPMQDNKRIRSFWMFLLGFTITGIVFFVIGFLISSHFYCKGSEYAECALGGIFVGGPICFTIATLFYLFFWTKK